MTQRFRNNINFKEFPIQQEKNSGISKTIPDPTMSLKVLQQRYASGLNISEKEPVYEDESMQDYNDGVNIKTLDLAEIQERLLEANERIENEKQEKQKKYQTERAERSARKEQEMRDKWRKEWENERPKT